ncbi:MAG TPA: HAD hydrolase family protein [Candidatus Dormibacteraeota bacterium]
MTKGSALEWVCRERGYDVARSIAFGDSINDLPMLQVARWSVGMANGNPSVLAIVDEVAPPNHEDGVARVLEEMLGISVGGGVGDEG